MNKWTFIVGAHTSIDNLKNIYSYNTSYKISHTNMYKQLTAMGK